MAECKIKDGTYITIQSFMIKDLKLKGNELLVYAIVYGFSQDGEQSYTGSLQYIADWLNGTRQGALKALKSLVDKGLLIKSENVINGVKFCEYKALTLEEYHSTGFNGGVQQSLTGCSTEFNGGVQQSLTNNITDIKKDKDIYKSIVNYLNTKTGQNYRANSKATQQHINARLKEGYTINDFKTVIDKKTAQWKGSDFEQYLRPSTLFGSKFENYLNAPAKTETQPINNGWNSESLDLAALSL